MKKRRERRHALDILHVPRLSVLPNFELLDCAPADGISAARNKRDSECPADGSASMLHYISGRGHGSFWHIASECDVCSNVICWGLSGLVMLTSSFSCSLPVFRRLTLSRSGELAQQDRWINRMATLRSPTLVTTC